MLIRMDFVPSISSFCEVTSISKGIRKSVLTKYQL
jgi:hypothetical protein